MKPTPRQGSGHREGPRGSRKPPLRVFTTTLWEYPSQHYDAEDGSTMQGDKAYVGATPSWVIWQLLTRYTRERDLVVDPMCGSGTTMDVARSLGRRALGYDLAPTRDDIFRADARSLPLEDNVADFVFVDPPYSTHINYSDDPRCIGRLDAADQENARSAGGGKGVEGYYDAMRRVISETHRVLKDRRYMGLYVSDSWRKRTAADGVSVERPVLRSPQGPRDGAKEPPRRTPAPATKGGIFMPIGFELFSIMREKFTPIDIIAVVRHNDKLKRGNWHKTAEEQNFFLRGFNYLFIMKKI